MRILNNRGRYPFNNKYNRISRMTKATKDSRSLLGLINSAQIQRVPEAKTNGKSLIHTCVWGWFYFNQNQFPESSFCDYTSFKDVAKTKKTKIHWLRHPGNGVTKLSYLALRLYRRSNKSLSYKKLHKRQKTKGTIYLDTFKKRCKKVIFKSQKQKKTIFGRFKKIKWKFFCF